MAEGGAAGERLRSVGCGAITRLCFSLLKAACTPTARANATAVPLAGTCLCWLPPGGREGWRARGFGWRADPKDRGQVTPGCIQVPALQAQQSGPRRGSRGSTEGPVEERALCWLRWGAGREGRSALAKEAKVAFPCFCWSPLREKASPVKTR